MIYSKVLARLSHFYALHLLLKDVIFRSRYGGRKRATEWEWNGRKCVERIDRWHVQHLIASRSLIPFWSSIHSCGHTQAHIQVRLMSVKTKTIGRRIMCNIQQLKKFSMCFFIFTIVSLLKNSSGKTIQIFELRCTLADISQSRLRSTIHDSKCEQGKRDRDTRNFVAFFLS